MSYNRDMSKGQWEQLILPRKIREGITAEVIFKEVVKECIGVFQIKTEDRVFLETRNKKNQCK